MLYNPYKYDFLKKDYMFNVGRSHCLGNGLGQGVNYYGSEIVCGCLCLWGYFNIKPHPKNSILNHLQRKSIQPAIDKFDDNVFFQIL